MNSIKTVALAIIGCALFLLFISARDVNTGKERSYNSDKINLALRQVSHHLYKLCGDDTSRIPPVSSIGSNKFEIELNQSLDYDEIPDLLNQALKDYNIKEKYYLTIRSCDEGNIVLGFNNIAFVNKEIPCQGREIDSGCNILSLTILDEERDKNKLLFYGIALLGLGGLLFFWSQWTKNNSGNIPIEIEQEESKNLSLGSTVFDLKNLKLYVGETEKNLTFREAKLLNYFLEHQNKILKREDILSHVWEDEGVIVGRSLDVFISRLRKILKEDTSLKIANIHGVGYRFEVS